MLLLYPNYYIYNIINIINILLQKSVIELYHNQVLYD